VPGQPDSDPHSQQKLFPATVDPTLRPVQKTFIRL
jgi:hypothetical protein